MEDDSQLTKLTDGHISFKERNIDENILESWIKNSQHKWDLKDKRNVYSIIEERSSSSSFADKAKIKNEMSQFNKLGYILNTQSNNKNLVSDMMQSQSLDNQSQLCVFEPTKTNLSYGNLEMESFQVNSGNHSSFSYSNESLYKDNNRNWRLSSLNSDNSYRMLKGKLKQRAHRLRIIEEEVEKQERAARFKLFEALKKEDEMLNNVEESLKLRYLAAKSQFKNSSKYLELSPSGSNISDLENFAAPSNMDSSTNNAKIIYQNNRNSPYRLQKCLSNFEVSKDEAHQTVSRLSSLEDVKSVGPIARDSGICQNTLKKKDFYSSKKRKLCVSPIQTKYKQFPPPREDSKNVVYDSEVVTIYKLPKRTKLREDLEKCYSITEAELKTPNDYSVKNNDKSEIPFSILPFESIDKTCYLEKTFKTEENHLCGLSAGIDFFNESELSTYSGLDANNVIDFQMEAGPDFLWKTEPSSKSPQSDIMIKNENVREFSDKSLSPFTDNYELDRQDSICPKNLNKVTSNALVKDMPVTNTDPIFLVLSRNIFKKQNFNEDNLIDPLSENVCDVVTNDDIENKSTAAINIDIDNSTNISCNTKSLSKNINSLILDNTHQQHNDDITSKLVLPVESINQCEPKIESKKNVKLPEIFFTYNTENQSSHSKFSASQTTLEESPNVSQISSISDNNTVINNSSDDSDDLTEELFDPSSTQAFHSENENYSSDTASQIKQDIIPSHLDQPESTKKGNLDDFDAGQLSNRSENALDESTSVREQEFIDTVVADDTQINDSSVISMENSLNQAIDSKIIKTDKPARGRGRRKDSIVVTITDIIKREKSLAACEGEVECGKCSVKFNSFDNFINHSFRTHAGLARIKGQERIFGEDEKCEILNAVFKKYKKLTCDNCKKKFGSVLGFKYHMSICGVPKEETYITCDVCSTEILKRKFKYHVRKHSVQSKKERPTKVKEPMDENIGRQKRKAAKACVNYLEAFMTEDKGTKQSQCSLKANEILNDHKFNKLLESNKSISCPTNNCKRSFTNYLNYKFHLKKCKKVLDESEITDNSDFCINDSSFSSDGDSSSSEKDSKPIKVTSSVKTPSLHGNLKLTNLVKLSEQISRNFRNENFSNHLFSDLLPKAKDWLEISEEDATELLLNTSLSIKFTFVNKDHKQNQWKRLKAFTGIKTDSKKQIFFAGSPITASSWCPTSSSTSPSQYIGLCSNTNPNLEVAVDDITGYPGLIQLWECGSLVTPEIPRLSLCIVHELGVGWSMEWCPSGIYEDLAKSNGETLNRLGMVAVAFSSGSIRIYHIPHPSQIEGKTAFFRKNPDISLHPSAYSKSEQVSCLNLSWSPSKGHALIAGSFSNGMICIWNLSSTTSNKECSEQNLYPIRVINAHIGCCSAVAFCPSTGGRHIVSGGGSDRYVRFWDIYSPEQPLSAIKKDNVVDLVWLVQCAGAYSSFDGGLTIEGSSTTYAKNGFTDLPTPCMLKSRSYIQCSSGSQVMNALVQANEDGDITVSFPKASVNNFKSTENMFKHKFLLSWGELEVLDRTINENSSMTNFSQATDKYGIKIYDDLTDKSKGIFKTLDDKVHERKSLHYLEFPINGVSSVSWNNNIGHHKWIFAGLNSGLGRIIQFPLNIELNRYDV